MHMVLEAVAVNLGSWFSYRCVVLVQSRGTACRYEVGAASRKPITLLQRLEIDQVRFLIGTMHLVLVNHPF